MALRRLKFTTASRLASRLAGSRESSTTNRALCWLRLPARIMLSSSLSREAGRSQVMINTRVGAGLEGAGWLSCASTSPAGSSMPPARTFSRALIAVSRWPLSSGRLAASWAAWSASGRKVVQVLSPSTTCGAMICCLPLWRLMTSIMALLMPTRSQSAKATSPDWSVTACPAASVAGVELLSSFMASPSGPDKSAQFRGCGIDKKGQG